MGDVRARVTALPNHFVSGTALSAGEQSFRFSGDSVPIKEFSITDDVMNISDCAAFTIANDDGSMSTRFQCGQKITIDLGDDDVAGGIWIRSFTGLITAIDDYTDLHGGSNLMITAYDFGWFLTSCHANPFSRNGKHRIQLRGNKTLKDLITLLIDPTWGFAETAFNNDTNRTLKNGRAEIAINFQPQLGAILPLIQIEPGMTPFDLLQRYASREGLLMNVSAEGSLVCFRPNYIQPPLYELQFHGTNDSASNKNNVIGRPTLRQSIDGIYTEVQCWSSVVIPPAVQNTENRNEGTTHRTYTPTDPLLSFTRRHVFSDGEAVSKTLLNNRTLWKYQSGLFNSWTYECDFAGLSQGSTFPNLAHGASFFVSDTMISINDSWRGITGGFYVQSVRRSLTLSEGARTHLVIRKPLLNPELTSLGAGAKQGARQKTRKAQVQR